MLELFKGSDCDVSEEVMLLYGSWAHTEIGLECVGVHLNLSNVIIVYRDHQLDPLQRYWGWETMIVIYIEESVCVCVWVDDQY